MTDDLVTDELVERASKFYTDAIRQNLYAFHRRTEELDDPMRTALLAIAPAIHAAGYRAGLERAAEVAVAKAAAHDAAAERMVTSALILQANSRADTCEDIATAIRAEKEPRHD